MKDNEDQFFRDLLAAKAYREAGNLRKAEDLLSAMLRDSPDSLLVMQPLLVMFYNADRLEKSRELALKMLAISKTVVDAHIILALVALREGVLSAATMKLGDLRKYCPADNEAVSFLEVQIETYLGKHTRIGYNYMARFHEMGDQYDLATESRFRSQSGVTRTKLVIDETETAVRKGTGNATKFAYAAALCERTGDNERALFLAKAALADDPTNRIANQLLGQHSRPSVALKDY
jgi:tetratricopeptide (TPR) repeat protein